MLPQEQAKINACNHSIAASGAADMLRYARAYAKLLGWYVFPVHNAIFDDSGNCTGCSCEHYRRSDACKNSEEHSYLYLGPTGKCKWPGKCPRVKWSQKSTIDLLQIDKWWGRPWRDIDVETGEIVYNIPNIGVDCGKSGLLVLDADTYKKVCGDLSDLLRREDRETVTVITQGGGEHFIYDRQGKPYGNATRGLPPGIDIRGVGSYFVAVPSLGKSGRRYQYEEAYKPSSTPLLPIPATLDAILSKAHSEAKPPVNGVVEGHTFLPSSDAEAKADKWLWKCMFRSKYGEQIKRLYDGDTTGFKSPSEADQSLCARLHFWTGGDLKRMDRMFRMSELYRPERWNGPGRKGETYGEGTIKRALSEKVYTGGVR